MEQQPITRWKAGEEMRKRNHVIPVRLNAKELRFLEEQVEKSGLSREEYIRSLVMGGEVRARPCEHHTELLRKISAQGRVCALNAFPYQKYFSCHSQKDIYSWGAL